jgi:hypothetical protein
MVTSKPSPNREGVEMNNLTPHAISLADAAGEIVATIPPSGVVARVAVTYREVGAAIFAGSSAAVVVAEYGAVEGLPPVGGGPYLVSGLVLGAVRGRDDVYAPDTGPTAVRDAAGRIVAVRRLVGVS